MDDLNPDIARLFAANEERRQELARCPIEDKIAAVVKMQHLAAPLMRARGREVEPWDFGVDDGAGEEQLTKA